MTDISELVSTGLSITLIGMSVVFLMLSALVGIVHAMSAFSRMFAEDTLKLQPESTIDAELIGVIGAAVHAYRSRRLPAAARLAGRNRQ